MWEQIFDILAMVCMYIGGNLMGYIECKKRFKIPKEAKSAKDIEVDTNGLDLT